MKHTKLILLFLLLGMAACAPSKPSPEQAIVGKWVNSGGGEINFYEDGTGFVPGFEEAGSESIPPFHFTYAFKDETHLVINMGNLPVVDTTGSPMTNRKELVIEIELKDDQMIWRASAGKVQYVYQRVES
jgi:hypothetical protein